MPGPLNKKPTAPAKKTKTLVKPTLAPITAVNLGINLKLDIDDLSDNLQQAEALAVILAVDLAQADTEFTENVIRHLITSLRDSLDGEPLDVEALLRAPD